MSIQITVIEELIDLTVVEEVIVVEIPAMSGGGGEVYTAGSGLNLSIGNEFSFDQSVIASKAYVDTKASQTLTSANAHSDTNDTITLGAAQNYADAQDAVVLSDANDYADSQDALTLSAANLHSDTEDAVTLNSAKAYADSIGATAITNPMTTTGDLIIGGASGAPTRLPVGGATQVLGNSGGSPSWVNTTPTPMMYDKTANYVITASDNGAVFRDTSAGGVQFTFPTPADAGNGWEVEVWNETGSGALTTKLNPTSGGQSIDGSTAQIRVSNKQGYRIISNGSVFFTRSVRATRFYAEGGGSGARASAPLSGSLAIGSGASSGSTGSLALGQSANAAGTDSIALMGTAVGTDAIAVRGTTSGIREIAIGAGSTTGTLLSTNGAAVAIGYTAAAQRDYAIALGVSSTASQIAELAFGSPSFAVVNQKHCLLYRNSITAASTDYILTTNTATADSTNQIICPSTSTVCFDGIVNVRRQGSGGTETMAWRVEGTMTRQTTGNVVLTGSTVTAIGGLTAPTGWTITLTADTTNQCLKVTFNMGGTAMTLRAGCLMRYVTINV